ncbi:MAG: class I SAM-dependent methyltransferase [Thermoleophilia bacterium]|nr:class I SAM-dependent methyltransferase [Thermoleophilia bacterium]
MNRVSALPGNDGTVEGTYDSVGRSTSESLRRMLPPDYDFSGRTVLDFGCGAGRTLRHFHEEAETAEFHGVDIDQSSVNWLNENLCPPLHVSRCGTEPPLDFADGSVDLAWAISVFAHLTDSSPAWLFELHRVLKPGGLLMASYMGEWNSESVAGEPWDPNRIGMNVLSHDHPWDEGGPMVLMSEWWMNEHWGRAFEIVRIDQRVHNQTWVLLRKKDFSITVEELMAPGDDPREWRALEHNIQQLRRESAEISNRYKTSLSWRVTRPLRAIRALLRRS